jgi:deazaflavin-dependent oxidoreductase (nitroreductase family)
VLSDLLYRALNAVHGTLLRVSRGRIGGKAAGMPVLELVTTGRCSGAPRTVLLTSPLRDGEDYVVVASRGGDAHHPAWFLNLRDEPRVQVSVQGGPRVPMLAAVATPQQRGRLWPQVAARSSYASHQRRTAREIPLVLLRPDPGR